MATTCCVFPTIFTYNFNPMSYHFQCLVFRVEEQLVSSNKCCIWIIPLSNEGISFIVVSLYVGKLIRCLILLNISYVALLGAK